MVCAGSMQGNTDPYVIQNGTPTAARYIIEILSPDFILMDDNAHPDRDCVTNKYLQTATMERMDQSARYIDLNPIEHTGGMLQTVIYTRPVQLTTVPEFQLALLTRKHTKAYQQYEKTMPSTNSIKWPPQAILKRISGTLFDFSEKTHFYTGPCYSDLLLLPSSNRCSASIVCRLIHFLSQ